MSTRIVDRHVGDLLDRRKSLGHQQMGDDFIDVEGIDEHLRAGTKLLGAALRLLGLGEDVDIPAGDLRGETHVLTPPADREAELIVGNHHFDPALLLVEHDLGHLRRRQRVDDERGAIG